MTEGSPAMMNPSNTVHSGVVPGIHDATAQDLVLVYAAKVPPQMEHWLRKRSMRLHVVDTMTVDPSEIRAMNARFVLIDVDALAVDSADLIRNLRAQVPETKILAITARGDEAFVRSLTESGASGVVVKQPYVADLVFALQAAQEGRTYISGKATERERAAVQITAREREVLELMANGHSNQSIGEKLSISVKTVEAHRARLFKKLGASNVADAVLLAIRTGLVMP